MDPGLIDCIEPSPVDPRAVGDPIPVPDPGDFAKAKAVIDALPHLIRFVHDVADWTETLDVDACDCATLHDLEEIGARAHELAVRLGGRRQRDSGLDRQLEELDRHAV